MVKMVDISSKGISVRRAIAVGEIFLRKETIELIKKGLVEKGDPLTIASIAGTIAAKKTPDIIPLCHPIPITNVNLEFEVLEDKVRVKAEVKSIGRTGVEMEALTAVTVALLNIWDVVKKYEKDDKGLYPTTRITGVKVLYKEKIPVEQLQV